MDKRLVLGTTNPAKIKHIQELLASLPIEILSPADLNIDICVEEDGTTPEANAEKKAKAYFAQSRMPTLALDTGLYIESLPDEKQPGVFVRRIHGADRRATDEEVLDYYARALEEYEGESRGFWRICAVLVTSDQVVISRSADVEIALTSRKSDILVPGAPMSSLIVNPASGRYYSELAFRERPGFEWIAEFIKSYLDELEAITAAELLQRSSPRGCTR